MSFLTVMKHVCVATETQSDEVRTKDDDGEEHREVDDVTLLGADVSQQTDLSKPFDPVFVVQCSPSPLDTPSSVRPTADQVSQSWLFFIMVDT
jgi:hypothetical protein